MLGKDSKTFIEYWKDLGDIYKIIYLVIRLLIWLAIKNLIQE